MITSLDLQRITELLFERDLIGKLDDLEKKLQLLEVIPSDYAPRNLVTMNSEVTMSDLTRNERTSLRLVYQLSPLYGNQTSVLSPLGTALLGMKINEAAFYRLRDGSYREIKIEEIIFQPEAQKQYEL